MYSLSGKNNIFEFLAGVILVKREMISFQSSSGFIVHLYQKMFFSSSQDHGTGMSQTVTERGHDGTIAMMEEETAIVIAMTTETVGTAMTTGTAETMIEEVSFWCWCFESFFPLYSRML